MNEIKDGGPAFPAVADGGCGPWPGMALRDYFAAKAMAALISATPIHPPTGPVDDEAIVSYRRKAAFASYEWADDMLAASKGGA